jgi:hypothetical protein
MLKKMLFATFFTAASINAATFLGIDDKGIDFGFGTGKVDFVIQGEFWYLAADQNYSAWTLSLSPNIEYRLLRTELFRLYGMSGVYVICGWYTPAYLNLDYFGDIYNDFQPIIAGANFFVLRPEAMLTRTISIYADIPILQVERGNQAGQIIWIVGGIPDGSGYLGSSSPIAIGMKIYF